MLQVLTVVVSVWFVSCESLQKSKWHFNMVLNIRQYKP